MGVLNNETQECECVAGNTGDQRSKCDATLNKNYSGKVAWFIPPCEREDG
ncbi:hypothetical protein F442_22475 [Phytophthora nicotianae P10297]|uniref:Uncharacterized protein n=1 Tax=Phytophthora nicotianae P10297 TaxID=1317064 RepID=W2Y0T8_PHYNI|nr:hypothetical protein F442_22475 [Phytophthora nicotianae P10297]